MQKKTLKARDVERLENTSLVTLVPWIDGAEIRLDTDECAHCDVTCVLGYCVDSRGVPEPTAPFTFMPITIKIQAP